MYIEGVSWSYVHSIFYLCCKRNEGKATESNNSTLQSHKRYVVQNITEINKIKSNSRQHCNNSLVYISHCEYPHKEHTRDQKICVAMRKAEK